MAQEKFRVGITRDNLKPDGKPIFDQASLKLLDDPRIEWEFLPQLETELSPETAAKYDALAVMLAKVTRQTVSGPNRRLKLIARFGVGYDTIDVPALTDNGVLLAITPDGVRRPVASSALTFMLMLAHRVMIKDRLVRQGRWDERMNHFGTGLSGAASASAVSSPSIPGGASSKGRSFASGACGAWSVAMTSSVPSFRPSIIACTSASVRSGGAIL
jgi:D-3-phosphoglycerate dehydrogenase